MRGADPSRGGRELQVRFPELPVVAYLRVMAWGDRASAALLGDPELEAIARANGVRVLDRTILHLRSIHLAAFHDAAARALQAGSTTMAPIVVAPYRLWSEGLANAERFAEWMSRFRGIEGPFPSPSREVDDTWSRLFSAARDTYAAGA